MTKAVFFLVINIVLATVIFSLNKMIFTLIGVFLLVEGIAIFSFSWLKQKQNQPVSNVSERDQ